MTIRYGKSVGDGKFQPGFREVDGTALTKAFSKLFQGGISAMDNIVATAGGTKAAAYALMRSLNHVATTASANDSVLLPPAIAGSEVVVINSGAQTLAVYGANADTIDGAATATAATIATTKAKRFTCVTKGAWFTTSAT